VGECNILHFYKKWGGESNNSSNASMTWFGGPEARADTIIICKEKLGSNLYFVDKR